MSVEIEPSELRFQRMLPHTTCGGYLADNLLIEDTAEPFNRELSQYLKITNLNKFPIAFKVCYATTSLLPSHSKLMRVTGQNNSSEAVRYPFLSTPSLIYIARLTLFPTTLDTACAPTPAESNQDRMLKSTV